MLSSRWSPLCGALVKWPVTLREQHHLGFGNVGETAYQAQESATFLDRGWGSCQCSLTLLPSGALLGNQAHLLVHLLTASF